MSIYGTNFNQISLPQFPTITPQAVQPFSGFGQNNIIGNLASTILGSLLGNMGGSGSLPGMTGISGGFNSSIFSMFSGPLAGFFNPITLPSFPQINTQPANTQPAETETAETVTVKPDVSESYPAEIKPKVEEMKAQLAKKLGVSPDSVKITAFKDKRSVYQFTLEVNGKKYHASISKTTGEISIHAKPTENNETNTSYPAELKPKIEEAKEKLGKKLGIPIESVNLVSVKEIKYDPNVNYNHMEPGYVITLEANGKKYRTHVYTHFLDKPIAGPMEIHNTANVRPKPDIKFKDLTPQE